MAENPTTYRIGYALAPKKVQSFIQPSLLNLAKERGLDLVPIQLTKPLIDQTPFACIIHKLSNPEWIDQLKQLLSQNPNVAVIDNPEAIDRLHNRVTMLQAISQLNLTSEVSLKTPHQVFVESPDSLPDSLASKEIKFPAVAKPMIADGTADSHQMYLVFDKEGLGGLKLNPPFVLQEFVNHGGVIFKVYVAGEHVRCVKRRSLPDISDEKSNVSGKSLSFSQISNVTAHDRSDDGAVDKLMEAVEMPPSGFVEEVADQLRRALRLNLFNFDMIRDCEAGGRYLVIDINYFPGYAKIPCYEMLVTDFLLDIVQKKVSDE